MNAKDEAMYEQMKERIRNVLITLNAYRAKNLDSMRIEAVMTQLEEIETALDTERWFKPSEIREMDFHLVEGSPFENNEHLERELQSIRNFVENKL